MAKDYSLNTALTESIQSHFKTVNDPRRNTKNKLHNFADILVIAICASVCGANNWTAVAAFARAKESWFSTFLELPNGIPSHDVFNDIFAKIAPDEFEKSFISWTATISKLIPGDVVSVDGKTLRRSYDKKNNKKSIHMVSAWSTSNALVLGQLKIDDRSNEITAIPELLDILSIESSLVTIDAMGCQKKIAEKILSKGADYLLAVKENQPNLYHAITDLFFNSDDDTFEASFSEYAEDSNKGHGRTEHRRCWVCSDIQALKLNVGAWLGLCAIVIIESERTLNNKTSLEQRIYISSKKQSAQLFLKAIREHWHIENKLHWILDVAFREDDSRLCKGFGAENFSILRRIALNLLKKEKTDKTGIETKRLRAGWDEGYLKTVLFGMYV